MIKKLKERYPKLYWSIRPPIKMKGYLIEDKPFSNFLEEQISSNCNSQAYSTIIDFGCAYAVKTKKLINILNLSYFIGVENNIWIQLFYFKKINRNKNFYIKRSLAGALKQFYKLHKSQDKRIIFIANASLMYLKESEKIEILNKLPRNTLIIVTEPKDDSFSYVFNKANAEIKLKADIPKQVYNPGYDAEILIAVKN